MGSLYNRRSGFNRYRSDNIDVDRYTPADLASSNKAEQNLLLFLHGGAYCLKTPNLYKRVLAEYCDTLKCIGILPDYRLAPEHPHPCGIEDCLNSYQNLLAQGYCRENIIILGDSPDGGKVSALSLDVTNPESVKQCFKTIEGEFGGLDILINKAGVASDPTKFVDITEEKWSWVVDTNMTGAWRVAQTATKQMIAMSKAGSIINISSIYGLHTGELKAGYNVSKAGVVQLTKSMAMELARYAIRVNALCPGWFLTDINSDYFASELGVRYVKSLPSRRLDNMNKLTVPLLMLASNKASSYINGSCITVDGGLVESPV